MKSKYTFVLVMLVTLLILSVGLTSLYTMNTTSEEKEADLTIVTSFYPIYIAALNLVDGVDDVACYNLSEPQTGCLHDYQLTPADMKLISQGDVFLVNGGGIESFLTEVAEEYPDLQIIEACQDLDLLSEEDEENAHAWMSVSCYRTMVATMARELAEADPDHAALYLENAETYDEKLEVLAEEQEAIREVTDGMKIISFHEAYAYVAYDYGMEIVCSLDFDEERPTSAGEVAEVLRAVQTEGATLILAEELYGSDMAETVLSEDDVDDLLVLYLDPLNKGNYDKDSYLLAMQANIDLLEKALVE